jgi:hypothetical protein
MNFEFRIAEEKENLLPSIMMYMLLYGKFKPASSPLSLSVKLSSPPTFTAQIHFLQYPQAFPLNLN